MLELVQETIKLTNGEPIPEIPEILDSFTVITADGERESASVSEPQNPAPEAPKETISPEPSSEKSTPDEVADPPPSGATASAASGTSASPTRAGAPTSLPPPDLTPGCFPHARGSAVPAGELRVIPEDASPTRAGAPC